VLSLIRTRTRAGFAGAFRPALQLLDPVLEQGRSDRRLVRLTPQPRRTELLRLLVTDLAGQRLLVRVDRDVDQRRLGIFQGPFQRLAKITGFRDVLEQRSRLTSCW
jgi:hypothetical protein